jgi:hypothetical protein
MPSSPRLAVLAIALVACSSMGCVKNGPPGPRVIPLAVRVHPMAALDAGDAKDILAGSSSLLKAANGPGDCACDVDLQLESFGDFEIGDGIVNSRADFNALFADTFANPSDGMVVDPDLAPRLRQVRVVSEIYWCDGVAGPSVAGCADQSGLRIAITRRSALVEGELWAHETGHTRGLHHRNDTWTAVMHETLLPDHKDLTVAECKTYRR